MRNAILVFCTAMMIGLSLGAPGCAGNQRPRSTSPAPQPAAPDEKTLAEIKDLIGKLGSDDPEVREAATERLVEIGEPALGPVTDAAKSDDPEVVNGANEITERIGIRARLPADLLKAFPGVDAKLMESRIVVGRGLGDLLLEMLDKKATHPELAAVIQEAMRHKTELSSDTRLMLAVCVGEEKIKEAAACLVELLKDEDAEVRGVATGALGCFHSDAKEYAKDIASLLKDDDSSVRSSAVAALRELGAKEFANQIAGVLNDEDSNVRWSAADALGTLGAREYAKHIAELLKDEDVMVKQRASEALGELGAKEYAKGVAELLQDGDSNVRTSAADALGNLGAKEYAKDIAALLKDADSIVRCWATSALGRLGAKGFAEDIAGLLRDKDSSVRSSAAHALKQLRAKEFAKDIAASLKDEDSMVRCQAAGALGELGAKEYAKEIGELLEDDDPSCIGVAGLALVKLGEPLELFMDRLLVAAKTDDNWTASLAMLALSRARSPELCAALDALKLPGYEFHGSLREMLTDIGTRTGLEVKIDEDVEVRLDFYEPLCTWNEVSAWVLLEKMASIAGIKKISIVIEGSAEKGKLRVVTHEEALKVFEAWWAERKKK